VDDPYALLGVARSASHDDVEHAYRRLAMAVHPDHADANDPRAVAAATQAFIRLGEARALLQDDPKRAAWNLAHPCRSVPPQEPRRAQPSRPVHRMPTPQAPAPRRLRSTVGGHRVVLGPMPPFSWRHRTEVGRTKHGLWLLVGAAERVPQQVITDRELYQVKAAGALLHPDDVTLLASNEALRCLDLSDTAVGDAEVGELCRLPHLQELKLDGTLITDAACHALARVRSLRALSIQETGVTDAGLAVLAGSPSIQALDLRHTRITQAGLGALDRMALRRVTLPSRPRRRDVHRLHEVHPGLLVT
jgi:hypothetical protein